MTDEAPVNSSPKAEAHTHENPRTSTPPNGMMESFCYDDGIVRLFLTATIVWGLIATLVGLLVAVLLVLPGLFVGLESKYEKLVSFGRLRPIHSNAAIFAFAGNAIFAAVYYSTQRLCQCRLWSPLLGRLHFFGWQAIIVAAAVTLPLGMTQGKEYAEFEWPIDLAIAFVWIGCFGLNFFMTLWNRRERHMYVSLWFYIASIITVAILHCFNNLVVPTGLGKSDSLYAGVQDAMMQWWYGHNLMAFFLTMPFLGLMYYFLPKAAERPIYSYRLSIIHFWSLVLMYVWAGPHHLHYTAIPEWLSTLGMIFGVMLWMPSWGGMINGIFVLRGAWNKVLSDPVLKFFFAGLVFYGVATFGETLLSIKSVSALSQNSDWTIAHVHTGALGWNGFMAFGMIYWLLPRLFQTKLWSKSLAELHFWLGTIGVLLYIIPIYAAGVMQATMWLSMDDLGRLRYSSFLESIQASVPYWWVRILGGSFYIVGIGMLALNALITWLSRPNKYEVPVFSAPRLDRGFEDEPTPPSSLAGTPVLELAVKLDKFASLGWHRHLERLPTRFTFWVTLIVVAVSLAELLPMFLIRSNVPIIATVQPYTPLELAGRDIYVSEGCHNCHSQMVRPLIAETQRFGEYSRAGEFLFDRPFQWGSRRIGPDLAREGVKKQSSYWHWKHFEDPSASVSGSVMPSFKHLLEEKLNFREIPKRVEAAFYLGAPYDKERTDAEAMAQKQAEVFAAEIVTQGGPVSYNGNLIKDSTALALIAYVQRLGTDYFAVKPAPTATGATATSDDGELK